MELKRPGGAERLNCPVYDFKCRSVTSVNRQTSFVLVYLVKLLANVSSSSQLLQKYQNDNYYCKE